MKLSDAMATGRVTIETWTAGHLNGCALGMAANAIGCEVSYSEIEARWPWISESRGARGKCPPAQNEAYEELRSKGLALAEAITENCPESADTTDAIRKVREAVMTANQAIACSQPGRAAGSSR